MVAAIPGRHTLPSGVTLDNIPTAGTFAEHTTEQDANGGCVAANYSVGTIEIDSNEIDWCYLIKLLRRAGLYFYPFLLIAFFSHLSFYHSFWMNQLQPQCATHMLPFDLESQLS